MTAMILKWPLKITDEQVVELPIGSKILDVQMQQDVLTIWTESDIDQKYEPVTFHVFGTGRKFNPAGLEYIGTVQERIFVWHVYKVTKA